MSEKVDTAVIGGGHAGLTMSYFLSQLGREHVILGIDDGELILAGDLAQNLARGDESLKTFKRAVDDYVTRNGLDFPAETSRT